MPGKRLCNSAIASPMVAALTSTSSSLLVNLRSGVGMRTFFGINYIVWSCTPTSQRRGRPWRHARRVRSPFQIVFAQAFLCGDPVFMRQQRFELAQARLDLASAAHLADHGVERLQTVAGDRKRHV